MKHFFLLLFLLPITIRAQVISGIVKDADTNKALPFATLRVEGDPEEHYADVNGKFALILGGQRNLIASYSGYESASEYVNGQKYIRFLLRKPTKNPGPQDASAIVREVISARAKNDPRLALRSFRFTSYNKLIVSAEPDSVPNSIDSSSIRRHGKIVTKADSTLYRFKKLVQNRHLFQTEATSELEFDGNNGKETVSGVKMAGFRQPVYELLALHLQSSTIYDDTYELFETKYNGPLSKSALRSYTYKILDTTEMDGRKVSVLFFRATRKHKAAKLQGLLFIDMQNFAVAKAIIQTRGLLNISAIHEFGYVPAHNLWFPMHNELKVIKGNNDTDIRILGETLKFGTDADNDAAGKRQASDYTYLSSRSWNFDTGFNVPVSISKPAIGTQITDDAPNKSEEFWKAYRRDGNDLRSINTYTVLDSIARKQRLEKKLFIGRKLINGYIPLGPFDVDLRYLLSYNNYEGFRFGFGGITNEPFSKKYRIEGYAAYGTKDGNFKYNLGAAARIGRFSNTWIGGAYTDDVREIASTTFAIDKRVFKLYDPRPINVSTFYHYSSWRGYIETKIIPKTESIWQLNYSQIEPKFGYLYTVGAKSHETYTMTTAMVSLQWNPFSSYMQTPVGRLESEKRFPKFTFQFTQALPDILDNDFEFGKLDLRAEYEKKFVNGQKSAALIEAGYAYGDAPLTHLYNTSPNNLTKDRLLQRITFAGKNSFETMYFNEFFSSRYVFFQLKHGSKRIKLLPKIKPSVVFVTRMAWGTMDKPEQHSGIEYKTLEEGYFESGIELNQIFKGFGLSGFYRYGPNQLARVEDNLAVKLSFILNLGL
ncbi:MAG TPA: DUF5686 family protein [Flavobacterium sp.]